MKNKYCVIDFEYSGTKQRNVNLVCCSLSTSDDSEPKEYWLHNEDEAKVKLKEKLEQLNEQGYIFLAYAVVAEARSFLSLGLDPTKFKFIDLFLEYKCLINHSDKLGYGRQLIDGKRCYTSSNKWAKNYKKPEMGLAAAAYKLLKVELDTEHKDFMRDLIISSPAKFSDEERQHIQNYCTSDIKYLLPMFAEMVKIYTKRLPRKHQESLKGEMLLRGDYAARTAVKESEGYPYNPTSIKNFANSVPYIMDDLAIDINSQFPEMGVFIRKPATRRFSKKEKPQREWIKTTPYADKWDMTKGGKGPPQYSLSLDAYQKFYNFTHDYPRDNFGAQMVRFLKTKQSLNGFLPKKPLIKYWDTLRSDGEKIIKQKSLKKSKTFFDYTNPKEGRVHPYSNPYGSQAGRNQASATGFIPLKAAWTRSQIIPKPGRVMIGLDWGQIQFFLKMLVARDVNGLRAYASGDVYLFFAKEAGAVPQDATKSTHKAMRDKFKATTLSIQFGMTKYGLAIKLTQDTGIEHTEDEAQELIDLFYEVFPESHAHDEEILEDYQNDGFLKSWSGWYMWGDNDNHRSVTNCPMQMYESDIMRLAEGYAQDAGLMVCYSLHDAIYIETNTEDKDKHAILLAELMDKAFRFYLPEDQKEIGTCKLDADIWGPDLPDENKYYELKYTTEYGEHTLPVKQQMTYVDERAQTDYDKFSKYFKDVFKVHLL